MGAILLSFLWGLRVWKVNKSYPDIPQKTYKAGERVNLSGSQMEENDNRDGYYLRIDEKNILSTDEYLNLYAEVSEKTEYDELVKNQNPVSYTHLLAKWKIPLKRQWKWQISITVNWRKTAV